MLYFIILKNHFIILTSLYDIKSTVRSQNLQIIDNSSYNSQYYKYKNIEHNKTKLLKI